MKRTTSILAIFLMLLLSVACQSKSDNVLYTKASHIGIVEAAFDEGVLYTKNFDDYLYYLDFNSGKSKIFCQDPSCSHDDETCGAYKEQMINYFIAGDDFYFVRPGDDYDSLYISDLNRQNERKLLSFDGKSHFSNIYIYKNTAYFFIEKEMNQEDITIDVNPNELYIVAFDLKSKKIVKQIPLASGFAASLNNIYGIYDEKILIHSTYLKDYIDWSQEDFDPEVFRASRETVFVAIDSETLEYSTGNNIETMLDVNTKIEKPLYLNAGYLYYVQDLALYSLDLKSKEAALVYDGELELSFPAEENFMYVPKSEPEIYYMYSPENKHTLKVYRPEGNILVGSKFLWREYQGKIYSVSTSLDGDYGGYKQNSSFIIEIQKDDLGKEIYTVKIVS